MTKTPAYRGKIRELITALQAASEALARAWDTKRALENMDADSSHHTLAAIEVANAQTAVTEARIHLEAYIEAVIDLRGRAS